MSLSFTEYMLKYFAISCPRYQRVMIMEINVSPKMSQCHVIKKYNICDDLNLTGKIEGVIETRRDNVKIISDFPWGNLKHRSHVC